VSNWQADFFQGVALELWRRVVTPEMTAADAGFLERTLQPPSNGRLLDVPCGNGRHAVELARRGYRIIGVDSSAEFLEEARATGAIEAHFSDMCDLPWLDEFDGAYCFGNSFGYLNRQDAGRFLSAIARALKPGARFAIDTGMAAESILPALAAARNRWHRAGDIFMLSESQYNTAEGRLDIQYTFIQGQEIIVRPSASYTFTVAELRRMHAEAGLEPGEMFGSAVGDPYQPGSYRLLLVSQKI
jgi:SAM-dependent methyltransferase